MGWRSSYVRNITWDNHEERKESPSNACPIYPSGSGCQGVFPHLYAAFPHLLASSHTSDPGHICGQVPRPVGTSRDSCTYYSLLGLVSSHHSWSVQPKDSPPSSVLTTTSRHPTILCESCRFCPSASRWSVTLDPTRTRPAKSRIKLI